MKQALLALERGEAVHILALGNGDIRGQRPGSTARSCVEVKGTSQLLFPELPMEPTVGFNDIVPIMESSRDDGEGPKGEAACPTKWLPLLPIVGT